jgi:hypothetical protein
MECQRQSIAEKLVPYIEGALADVDRREVHEHLQECQMCNQEFRSLRDVVSCLRNRVGHTLHYLPAISLSPDDVVDYALDAGRLSETTRRRIQLQLVESLDSQQEVEWLRELEQDLDRVETISPPPFPATLSKALDAAYGAEGRKVVSVFPLNFTKPDFLKRVQPRYLAAGLAGLLFTGMAAHSMLGNSGHSSVATTAGSVVNTADKSDMASPASASPAAASATPVSSKDEVALLPEKVHPDDLPRLSRLLWDKKVAHSYRDGQIYVAGEDVEMAWSALRMNEGRQVAAAELKAGKLAKGAGKESIVAIGQTGKPADEKFVTNHASLLDKLDAKLKGASPASQPQVAKQSKTESFKKEAKLDGDKAPVTWGNRYVTPGKPDSTTETRPSKIEYGPSGAAESYSKPSGTASKPNYYIQGGRTVNPPSQQASSQFRQSTVAVASKDQSKPAPAPAAKPTQQRQSVPAQSAAETNARARQVEPKLASSHTETVAVRQETQRKVEPKPQAKQTQEASHAQDNKAKANPDLGNLKSTKPSQVSDGYVAQANTSQHSTPPPVEKPAVAKPAAPKVAVTKPVESKPAARERDYDAAPRPAEVAINHNSSPVSNVQSARVSRPAKVSQPAAPAQVAMRTQEPVPPPAPRSPVTAAPVSPPPAPAPVVSRPPAPIAAAPQVDDLKTTQPATDEENGSGDVDLKKRKETDTTPAGMKTVPRWSDRQAHTEPSTPAASPNSAPVAKPTGNRVVLEGGIGASDSTFMKMPAGGASRSNTPASGIVSAGAIAPSNKSVPPKDPGDLILFKQAQKIVADMQLDAELKFERRDDNSLMITVKPQRALNQLETEQLRKALRKKLKLDDTDSVVIRQP